MGEMTSIAWCHHTFSPWWGCVRVSPGCENCYAESNDARWFGDEAHWGVSAGRRFFGDAHWNEPHKWNQKALKAGVRRRVFCASMCDIFEDRHGLAPHRERLWGVIDDTKALDWLLLTKRPENINRLKLNALPWERLWFGATGENGKYAVERADELRGVDAAVRFISYEPALGPVDWDRVLGPGGIDWVIGGGESGMSGKTRECQLKWLRDMVAACRRYGVVPFVKQLGRFPRSEAGQLLQLKAKRAGDDFGEFPAELQIREFPVPRAVSA